MEKETVDKLTCRKSITNFYDDKNLVTPETLKSTKTKKKSGKWVYLSSSETEEDLVTNYGNLLTTVESDILTLVIEKYENKVSLKIYTNYKLRTRGNRFFVKRKKVDFLTINTKTFDIYVGVHSVNRKIKKTIKRNVYNTLSSFQNKVHEFLNKYRIYQKDIQFDSLPKDGYNRITKVMSDVLEIDKFDKFVELYHWRMKNIGLKYPNNYEVFFNGGIGLTLKHIRKSNFKLIDTIMSIYGLSGKKIRATLHEINHFNMNSWDFTKKVIQDPINELDKNTLVSVFQYPSSNGIYYVTDIDNVVEKLSNKEKKCLKTIFTIMVNEQRNLQTLIDHLLFKHQLATQHGWRVEFKSTTMSEFNNEHYQWTEEIDSYTKGDYYRTYNSKFLKQFNTEIVSMSGGVYYPVVLQSSEDYNDESLTQNNCVRTYKDSNSVLISLRLGHRESDERASVEYRTYSNKGKISYKRVQYLGKFNSKLNDMWDDALEQLDDIFEKSLEYLKEGVYLYHETKKNKERFTFSLKDGNDQYGFYGINK
jgi:hypothetical protein